MIDAIAPEFLPFLSIQEKEQDVTIAVKGEEIQKEEIKTTGEEIVSEDLEEKTVEQDFAKEIEVVIESEPLNVEATVEAVEQIEKNEPQTCFGFTEEHVLYPLRCTYILNGALFGAIVAHIYVAYPFIEDVIAHNPKSILFMENGVVFDLLLALSLLCVDLFSSIAYCTDNAFACGFASFYSAISCSLAITLLTFDVQDFHNQISFQFGKIFADCLYVLIACSTLVSMFCYHQKCNLLRKKGKVSEN